MALPFVPCLNSAYVQLQYAQASGDFAAQGYWVKRDEAWDHASLDAMSTIFRDWWTTGDGTHAPVDFIHNSHSLVAIAARDYTTETSLSTVFNTGLPIDGSIADSDLLSQGLSFAITLRTGLAGRSYRGRSFLLGLTKSALDGGQGNIVDSTVATHIRSAYTALIAAVSDGDAHSKLAILSRYWNEGIPLGPVVSRVAGIATPVTDMGFHDLFVDFQRRRAPAHNRHH